MTTSLVQAPPLRRSSSRLEGEGEGVQEGVKEEEVEVEVEWQD